MPVQTLVTQAPIKRVNEGTFHGFARPNKVERYTPPIGPILQGARLEFASMIDGDGPRAQDTIKHLTHRLSRHAKSRLSYRTTATPGIDDRQDPKWSPVGRGIMDDIHAPVFYRTGRDRGRSTMQGPVLPSTYPHAELSSIYTRPPTDACATHQPALSPQHSPDLLIAEPRSGMGQIPNAEPEGRLILGPTCSIPRGSPELRQPTGPSTTHREGAPEPVGQFPAAGGP